MRPGVRVTFMVASTPRKLSSVFSSVMDSLHVDSGITCTTISLSYAVYLPASMLVTITWSKLNTSKDSWRMVKLQLFTFKMILMLMLKHLPNLRKWALIRRRLRFVMIPELPKRSYKASWNHPMSKSRFIYHQRKKTFIMLIVKQWLKKSLRVLINRCLSPTTNSWLNKGKKLA